MNWPSRYGRRTGPVDSADHAAGEAGTAASDRCWYRHYSKTNRQQLIVLPSFVATATIGSTRWQRRMRRFGRFRLRRRPAVAAVRRHGSLSSRRSRRCSSPEQRSPRAPATSWQRVLDPDDAAALEAANSEAAAAGAEAPTAAPEVAPEAAPEAAVAAPEAAPETAPVAPASEPAVAESAPAAEAVPTADASAATEAALAAEPDAVVASTQPAKNVTAHAPLRQPSPHPRHRQRSLRPRRPRRRQRRSGS